MKTPRLLTAALGAGFYRYWHVPSPSAAVDVHTTRRADLSVIGPAALALLAASTWVAGRLGVSLLLVERVTVPLSALPWAARLLAGAGLLGLALAALWWLGTAPMRARVARAVATGSVARIPDEAATPTQPLHAAVSELGHRLRDLPEAPPLAEPAFDVLRTATEALAGNAGTSDQRRLRRRCLTMAQRLERGPQAGRRGPHRCRGRVAA